MEKLIVEEICKNLKWYERIIAKSNKKLIFKIYNYIRIKMFNMMIK